jgi:glycosyltransferase involved in cell wall biosynthesis
MKKEDSTIKLSIIIPFYKTYDLTCVLLDNLCKQLNKQVEIILIDDGCNEIRLDKYPITVLHLPENKGLSYARNRGIEKATGKYVVFVDSDDNVSDKYIKTILNKIKTSDFDYCMFSWKFTGIKNEEVLIKDEAPEWNRCVWNCVYKKEIIGLFEEGIQIHEDSIFNLKYRKGKRENIEEVLYYYFFNRKDSISNRFAEGKTKVQEEWNTTLLSIIIPYYKTYELTRSLLDELCKQYNNKIEIILIQDGCNDNFDKYPIKIIKKENGGVSSARNKGLDTAIGKYIAFIDSDDMIKDNYVSKLIDTIENKEFDYCLFSWEATGRIKGQFIIKDNPPSWNTCVWNCIYKRDLIGNTRFNENKIIEEDTEFNEQARKGKKENIEDVLYIYNSGREGSITSTYKQNSIKQVENKNEINTQVIVYRSFLSKIGGIETAIYNFCLSLKDKYDIVFVYLLQIILYFLSYKHNSIRICSIRELHL